MTLYYHCMFLLGRNIVQLNCSLLNAHRDSNYFLSLPEFPYKVLQVEGDKVQAFALSEFTKRNHHSIFSCNTRNLVKFYHAGQFHHQVLIITFLPSVGFMSWACVDSSAYDNIKVKLALKGLEE